MLVFQPGDRCKCRCENVFLGDCKSHGLEPFRNRPPGFSRGIGHKPELVLILFQEPYGIRCSLNWMIPNIEYTVKIDEEPLNVPVHFHPPMNASMISRHRCLLLSRCCSVLLITGRFSLGILADHWLMIACVTSG